MRLVAAAEQALQVNEMWMISQDFYKNEYQFQIFDLTIDNVKLNLTAFLQK